MDQFELDYLIGDSPISPDHKELLDRAANKIEATIPRGGQRHCHRHGGRRRGR